MGSFKVQASRIQPSHRLAVSSTDPEPWAGWAACKVWCTAKPQPLCLDKKAKRTGRVKLMCPMDCANAGLAWLMVSQPQTCSDPIPKRQQAVK